MNHSCEPTVEVVLHAPDAADGGYRDYEVRVARDRDLRAGDELTFFYPSTEWDCVAPFRCLCGSSSSSSEEEEEEEENGEGEEGKRCIGMQQGSKYLSDEALGRYFLNQHIHSLLAERGQILVSWCP